MKKLLNKKVALTSVIIGIVAFLGFFGFSFLEQERTVYAEILAAEKPVSSEKEWTITFNTEVSLESARNHILVNNESTGSFKETKVNYGDTEKQIIVSPRQSYEYGETFILKVEKGLESTHEKALKEPKSMRFEIKTMNPINNYSSEVFSTGYAEMKEGQIYFKGEQGEKEPYLLAEEDRPLINNRINNLSRALVEKGTFTGFRHYAPGTKESRAVVKLAKHYSSWVNGYTAFDYYIYEHRGFNAAGSWFDDKLTENAEVVLHLNSLAYDYEKMDKETYSVPKYEEKLKKSLQVLYPENYKEIYSHIFQYYIEMSDYYADEQRGEAPSPGTKTFGNIKVDHAIGLGKLIVYFTKVGEDQ